jgi:hypothetical protein
VLNSLLKWADQRFNDLFTPKRIRKAELIILRLSVIAFLAHILIIFVSNHFVLSAEMRHSYLKAIFTPFSFILFYEVFLLVVIIPQSISEFIGKQFEIITLITLRSFFHDIAEIDLSFSVSFSNPEITGLLYDLGASLLMLGITILYYKIYRPNSSNDPPAELKEFIAIKKMVSLSMVVILALLSLVSLYAWSGDMVEAFRNNSAYPDPNTVFYSDFFTIMIFVDVFLLLVSFMYHFTFFSVFRNASFVITTILIRTSLGLEKPDNYFLILTGFLFSLSAYYLYRLRPVGQK